MFWVWVGISQGSSSRNASYGDSGTNAGKGCRGEGQRPASKELNRINLGGILVLLTLLRYLSVVRNNKLSRVGEAVRFVIQQQNGDSDGSAIKVGGTLEVDR